MPFTKRKASATRRARTPETAQLRPRLSDAEAAEGLDQTPPAKKMRTDTPTPTKKEELQKPFRLMDLAAELRILIYEEVLESHPTAKLSRSPKHRELTSTSALTRVSKQIRNEFLGVLITSAPIVETVVQKCQFSHVITFLNRLSAINLEKMTAVNASRVLRITLKGGTVNEKQLRRWLNRSQTEKKGAKIDFQYISSGPRRMSCRTSTEGRATAEFQKMRAAVLKGSR